MEGLTRLKPVIAARYRAWEKEQQQAEEQKPSELRSHADDTCGLAQAIDAVRVSSTRADRAYESRDAGAEAFRRWGMRWTPEQTEARLSPPSQLSGLDAVQPAAGPGQNSGSLAFPEPRLPAASGVRAPDSAPQPPAYVPYAGILPSASPSHGVRQTVPTSYTSSPFYTPFFSSAHSATALHGSPSLIMRSETSSPAPLPQLPLQPISYPSIATQSATSQRYRPISMQSVASPARYENTLQFPQSIAHPRHPFAPDDARRYSLPPLGSRESIPEQSPRLGDIAPLRPQKIPLSRAATPKARPSPLPEKVDIGELSELGISWHETGSFSSEA